MLLNKDFDRPGYTKSVVYE